MSLTGKPLLNLSLGDPTAFGNLFVPDVLREAVVSVVQSNAHNGYGPSAGLPAARQVIAVQRALPAPFVCVLLSSLAVLYSGIDVCFTF